MIAQHKLLNEVAAMVDNGTIRTTLDETFGTINAANLKRAHALMESGKRAARSCWRGGRYETASGRQRRACGVRKAGGGGGPPSSRITM